MVLRLFPSVMEQLAEPVSEKAFIDILNRLEKLQIIESASHWIELRKIRYDVVHKYPASLMERIEGINILYNNMKVLKQIVDNCRSIYQTYK